MATIAGVTLTFGLPENDTRRQNSTLGQAQDLTWKYFKHGSSDRILEIPLHGLTTTVKNTLAAALESQKANAITLVNGGADYHQYDILSSVGDTYPVKAIVLTLTGSAVASISMTDRGSGVTIATKATTDSPANGTGCTFSVDTLTDQLTIVPDAHVDLGGGAGVAITAQWIDPVFDFRKNIHDSWSGVLNFVRVS